MLTESRARAAPTALLAVSLVGAAVLPAAADGEGGPTSLLPAPAVATLMTAYLECERAAQAWRLGSGEAMVCSELYEELKVRAFGGSFEALRRWYLLQPGIGPGLGA